MNLAVVPALQSANIVEVWGIEPQTLGLQIRCSPAELNPRGRLGIARRPNRQESC